MKLYQAILKGSEQRPQVFGQLFLNHGNVIGSCALGAAYEGLFGQASTEAAFRSKAYFDLLSAFPILLRNVEALEDRPRDSLLNGIIDLNDNLKWTREEIAAYVKQIEGDE